MAKTIHGWKVLEHHPALGAGGNQTDLDTETVSCGWFGATLPTLPPVPSTNFAKDELLKILSRHQNLRFCDRMHYFKFTSQSSCSYIYRYYVFVGLRVLVFT